MKKYTIKDSLGSKKTVYAENLSHALTFVDSKARDLEDSIHDATFKESNNVYYKFERGYWHVLSIHNKTEMDHQDVMSLARKNNVMIEPYFKYDYHRTDKGGYYTDYKVKGKDKNGVIKFCETMNPIVKPLTFSDDIEDSKIVDEVKSAETYANTSWIENFLARDIIAEGQKADYDFFTLLKIFDNKSKQILAAVKNALDKAKKEIINYKSRY